MNDQPKDQRPTPITDRIARAACDDKGMLCRPQLLWDALERLERDLAEAREQLAALRSKYADHHAEADRLTNENIGLREQLAAERALADRLAEALDPCLNLSQGWVSYYSTSPQYGNGTTSPVHERILDYAIQSLSAHRAARGAQND